MRSWWLFVLAACGGHTNPLVVPVAVAPPSSIAAGPVAPPLPAGPEATVVRAVEVRCAIAAAASSPADPACTPRVVGGASGPIAQVWEVPCARLNAPQLLDDAGAARVVYGYNGTVRLLDEHGVARALPKDFKPEVIAAHTLFGTFWTDDGTRLWHDGHCEIAPQPIESNIVARSDGALVMWGRAAGESPRVMERMLDGTWRLYPPVRPDIGAHVVEQAGQVLLGYGTNPQGEVGYADPAHRLQPIRRGTSGTWFQLAPGDKPDGPPAAVYIDREVISVEQPDAELGFRRIALTLDAPECPQNDNAYERAPKGRFAHQTQPVLFRADHGGLWLAYGEARGRCKYRLVSQRARGASPFLFAHPPPPPPRWVATEIVTSTELVLVPVGRRDFGPAIRSALPAAGVIGTGGGAAVPVVGKARITLTVGALIVDLDPTRLPVIR